MASILLIEDNPEIRHSMAEILTLSGYQILKADNGLTGVKMAKDHLPDLIICDVMMPDLDGFGALSLLGKDETTQAIPFIFLTSKMESGDIRKGMNLGADDYLTKPFELSELLHAIEIRLQKAASRQIESPVQVAHAQHSSEKGQQALAAWLQDWEPRHFQAEQLFFAEGTEPAFLYFLHEGVVRLQSEPEPGRLFVRELRYQPSFLSLDSALYPSPQLESAIAMTEGRISAINKEAFQEFIRQEHTVYAYLSQRLAHRHQYHIRLQAQYAFASVRKRVAMSLYRLFEIFAFNEIEMPRDLLASLSAVSRGGLMRVLAEFREDGLIATDHTRLRILEADTLKQMPD